eukprot:463363-Pleurochrysis_carterae.AAC.1
MSSDYPAELFLPLFPACCLADSRSSATCFLTSSHFLRFLSHLLRVLLLSPPPPPRTDSLFPVFASGLVCESPCVRVCAYARARPR